jgi:hypothetical protein
MITKDFILDENNELIEVYTDTETGKTAIEGVLKLRYRIQEDRGDVYDLVSQSLQWNGLLTSALGDIYGVLTEEQKDNLTDSSRGLLEATFAYYKNTTTVSDMKLKESGFDYVKSLIDSEAKTAVYYEDDK